MFFWGKSLRNKNLYVSQDKKSFVCFTSWDIVLIFKDNKIFIRSLKEGNLHSVGYMFLYYCYNTTFIPRYYKEYNKENSTFEDTYTFDIININDLYNYDTSISYVYLKSSQVEKMLPELKPHIIGDLSNLDSIKIADETIEEPNDWNYSMYRINRTTLCFSKPFNLVFSKVIFYRDRIEILNPPEGGEINKHIINFPDTINEVNRSEYLYGIKLPVPCKLDSYDNNIIAYYPETIIMLNVKPICRVSYPDVICGSEVSMYYKSWNPFSDFHFLRGIIPLNKDYAIKFLKIFLQNETLVNNLKNFILDDCFLLVGIGLENQIEDYYPASYIDNSNILTDKGSINIALYVFPNIELFKVKIYINDRYFLNVLNRCNISTYDYYIEWGEITNVILDEKRKSLYILLTGIRNIYQILKIGFSSTISMIEISAGCRYYNINKVFGEIIDFNENFLGLITNFNTFWQLYKIPKDFNLKIDKYTTYYLCDLLKRNYPSGSIQDYYSNMLKYGDDSVGSTLAFSKYKTKIVKIEYYFLNYLIPYEEFQRTTYNYSYDQLITMNIPLSIQEYKQGYISEPSIVRNLDTRYIYYYSV